MFDENDFLFYKKYFFSNIFFDETKTFVKLKSEMLIIIVNTGISRK